MGRSQPVVFNPPVPVTPHGGAGNDLLVEALSPSSVRFWWRELNGPPAFSPRKQTPAGTPRLEYRIDVSHCLNNGGLERHRTVLFEDAANGIAPFDAIVHGLLPGAKYFAVLVTRFARLGCREWCRTGH